MYHFEFMGNFVYKAFDQKSGRRKNLFIFSNSWDQGQEKKNQIWYAYA